MNDYPFVVSLPVLTEVEGSDLTNSADFRSTGSAIDDAELELFNLNLARRFCQPPARADADQVVTHRELLRPRLVYQPAVLYPRAAKRDC